MAHTDTTAEQRRSSVDENKEAISLKADVITSFWPHLIYLGDFHSHPFKNTKEVRNNKMYFMSQDDREWLKDNFWKQKGYRVGLIMTLAAMEKPEEKQMTGLPRTAWKQLWATTECGCPPIALIRKKVSIDIPMTNDATVTPGLSSSNRTALGTFGFRQIQERKI